MRTEFDATAVRQKYITNQALDKHGRTPLCTRCALGTGAHSSECRARFEVTWTKELAEAEVASRADDSIPVGPDVKESESLKSTEAAGQPVEMEESAPIKSLKELAEHRRSWTRSGRNLWMCRWIKAPQQVLQSEEQKHNYAKQR